MTAVHPLDTPLSRFLGRLTKAKKQSGDQWSAICPAHEDRTPSLRVKAGPDGRVLMKCQAGCTTQHICQSLNIPMSELFPPRPSPTSVSPYKPPKPVATYDYVDEHGTLLFQSVRYEPKDFRQKGPNGEHTIAGCRLVPYRLPEIIAAVDEGRTVYVVEGEKDADALAECGYAATTNPMGAKKWSDEYSTYLRGASVVVLPDNDESGKAHAHMVANSLYAHDCSVRIVELPGLPEKGDVSDWLSQGHDLDELEALIGRTKLWSPDPSDRNWWWLEEILADDEAMRPPTPCIPYMGWKGRCTLFAASEKLGKSTLLGFIASQCVVGGMFLNEPVHRGTVLVIGLEETRGDVARRLRHFGLTDPRKSVAVIDRLRATELDGRIAEIQAVMSVVKPDVVLVDTLIAFGDATVSDWTASAQAAPVVNALTRLAHESGAAVILVHHATKATGKYRDSSAIGGAVDAIAELTAPKLEEDPTLRKLDVRGRMGMFRCQFRFDGDTYVIDRGDEAPLDYRIREFIRGKVKCSVRDVQDAVKGRAESIGQTIVQMLADGRLLNLTPNRKHKTLAVPDSPQTPIHWTDA